MAVITSSVAMITFVATETTLITSSRSLAKIIVVVGEVTFKVAVITSSVAQITYVVAEIILEKAVITSSVATITFVITPPG